VVPNAGWVGKNCVFLTTTITTTTITTTVAPENRIIWIKEAGFYTDPMPFP